MALAALSPARLRNAYHDDWFWEGNVQQTIAGYLTSVGWRITSMADAGNREHGVDIHAVREKRVLRVEVKGFPSANYADPRRAAEKKRARPSAQASHWFSQALLKVMRDLHANPRDEVAIGLPFHPRFVSLVQHTEAPLRRLRIGVYVVHPTGAVETVLPHQDERWKRFVDMESDGVRIVERTHK